jgi:hypothetical protein
MKRRSKPVQRKRLIPITAGSSDVIDPFVTAAAQALGLSLDAAWHAGVAFNLRLIMRHARLVDEFALPDDAEPAPVFHA